MSEIISYWLAGGPLMVPLAGLCFAIWYWVVALARRLREERTELPARAESYALDGSPGAEVIRDRLLEIRLAEVSPFARQLRVLRVLVVSAPLLGLLGTVKGMITTFLVLSARGTASIELISTGISEALVTTQVGLVAALPGTLGLAHVYRLFKTLENALDLCETRLGLILEHGGGAAT